MSVPDLRIRAVNAAPLCPAADYVLYWMTAARRVSWNFAFDRAVEHARELGKPLVVFEALRVGYQWASDRLHRFVIEGMCDNGRRLAERNVTYYPYVESTPDADKGLLAALAERACVIVTDEFPSFFLPRMIAKAAARLSVRVEAIDSNGLLPLAATEQVFTTAFSFRRYLQKALPPYLEQMPQAHPLARSRLHKLDELPPAIVKRWPPAQLDALLAPEGLAKLPIDHKVGPAAFQGGTSAAEKAWQAFLHDGLARYSEERSEPESNASSGLSPYLHFGHISAHQVFCELMERERWTPDKLAAKPNGKREGWWGASVAAESFLDELITWREVGYNLSSHQDDYDQYESLPAWARATLEKHARDPRPTVYSLAEFEAAKTHDPLWNAAQRQLVREGRMHNYLRMLWGKKILEWSRTPRAALDVMIELNNKYAVDGRNPNSYSGIFWCLGRYDRAWGPERPIFGTVRYMSSDNTARKFSVKGYLARYA